MRQHIFQVIGIALILVVSVGFAAAENDYDQPVSQLDFAVGVHSAVVGQGRASLDPNDSLQMLKDRGIIPGDWAGEADVTMGQAQEIFGKLGIQIYISEPEALLSRGRFERILRENRGAFQLSRQHWRMIHDFSNDLTLGQYRQRIIASDHGGAPVSPSGF